MLIFINPTCSWEEFLALIQLILAQFSFHHSSFYFSNESHSRRNVCRRNVCRRSVVDKMSVSRRVVVIPARRCYLISRWDQCLDYSRISSRTSIICYRRLRSPSKTSKEPYDQIC